MTRRDRGHGQDSDEVCDPPGVRHPVCRGQQHHGDDHDDGEQQAILEAPQDLGDLDEKVGKLRLLARGAPGHVDFEHVCQQRLRDVQGQPTQEDAQHEDPFEILCQRGQEGLVRDAVAHDRESDVAQAVEDDDDGEPDLPAVDVVFVEVSVVPADGEVVCGRHDPCRADGVIRSYVGDDGDLGGEANIAEEEAGE